MATRLISKRKFFSNTKSKSRLFCQQRRHNAYIIIYWKENATNASYYIQVPRYKSIIATQIICKHYACFYKSFMLNKYSLIFKFCSFSEYHNIHSPKMIVAHSKALCAIVLLFSQLYVQGEHITHYSYFEYLVKVMVSLVAL